MELLKREAMGTTGRKIDALLRQTKIELRDIDRYVSGMMMMMMMMLYGIIMICNFINIGLVCGVCAM